MYFTFSFSHFTSSNWHLSEGDFAFCICQRTFVFPVDWSKLTLHFNVFSPSLHALVDAVDAVVDAVVATFIPCFTRAQHPLIQMRI